MKTSIKIFITASLGAMIGSLVALNLNPLFWWIGLIIGALVGYLSYEFTKVVKATKKAIKQITNISINLKKETIIARVMGYLATSAIVYGFLILVHLINFKDSLKLILNGYYFLFIEFPVWASIIVYLFWRLTVLSTDIPKEKQIRFTLKEKKDIILYANPITLPFTLVYLLSKFLFEKRFVILKALKKSIAFIFADLWVYMYKAGKFVFVQIHSDIRIICMVSAAIGTVVGYVMHAPIIGAIVGGVVGVISFRVVSLRILKLDPKNK